MSATRSPADSCSHGGTVPIRADFAHTGEASRSARCAIIEGQAHGRPAGDTRVEPLPETREALAELVSTRGAGSRRPAERAGSARGRGRPRPRRAVAGTEPRGRDLHAGRRRARGPRPSMRPSTSTAVRASRSPRAGRRSLEVDTHDPLDEERWRIFAGMGAAAGVASSLSLPVYREGRLVGGLNLYAASQGAFSGHHDALAGLVGADSAEAVSNADLSFSSRQTPWLRRASCTTSRSSTRRSVSIAGLQGVEVEVAERRLREAAARSGIPEALVARALVLALRPGPGVTGLRTGRPAPSARGARCG